MVKKIVVSVILVAVIAAIGYFVFRSQSDEELIIERLELLSGSVSKKSNEGAITMAVKHQTISGLIAEQCSVFIKEAMLSGDFTPEEFAAQMTRARAMFKSLDGQIDDCEVELDATKTKATITFAIRITATSKSGGKIDEVRDLQATAKKIDGKWLFSSFEIRQVLEK